MSIFSQNMESTLDQAMVDPGSRFYDEVLSRLNAPISGLPVIRARYFQGDLVLEEEQHPFLLSIDKNDDLFRAQLPNIKSITAPHGVLKAWYRDMDGHNIQIMCDKFLFRGDSVKNLSVTANRAVINAEHFFNVDLAVRDIHFISVNRTMHHKWRENIPSGDNTVHVSPDATIVIRVYNEDMFFSDLYKILDRSTMDIGSHRNWNTLYDYIYSRTPTKAVLPLCRKACIQKLLDLPEYLCGVHKFAIVFQNSDIRPIYFAKEFPSIDHKMIDYDKNKTQYYKTIDDYCIYI